MNEEEERSPFKVMVVDDDKDLREMLVTLVNTSDGLDAEAFSFSSGEEAHSKLTEENFDIVIADQRMEGISGIELLTRIKDEYPDMVRILITGYSDLKTAKEAINKAKVHHYLEKPCSNEEIISTLHRELERLDERRSAEVVKVDHMIEAIDLLENFKETFTSISRQHPGIVSFPRGEKEGRYKLILEFNSSSEFNKFSFELKDNGELQANYQPRIEDVQVFENRYLVTVSLKP